MSGSRALGIVAVVLVASALAVGCAPTEPDAGRDESDAQRGPGNDAAMAPTLTAIGNLTFAGIEDGPVTLVDGLWEGAPFAPGGASRPSVGLAEDFQISGDLDGDGAPETVVVLWQSSGGSGTFDYLAVVGRRRAALVNLGTAPLGDRVQIRDARVDQPLVGFRRETDALTGWRLVNTVLVPTIGKNGKGIDHDQERTQSANC